MATSMEKGKLAWFSCTLPISLLTGLPEIQPRSKAAVQKCHKRGEGNGTNLRAPHSDSSCNDASAASKFQKSKISSQTQNWTRSLARSLSRNSPRRIDFQSHNQILLVCTTTKSTQSSAYNHLQIGMPTIRSAGPLDPQPWQRRRSDLGTPIHQTQNRNATETLPNCTRPTSRWSPPPLSFGFRRIERRPAAVWWPWSKTWR